MNPTQATVGELFYWIVSGILALFSTILGIMFKRDRDRADKLADKVDGMALLKADKKDVDALSGCISKVKEDYITKEDFNAFKNDQRLQNAELTKDVKRISENYLKQTDFFRVQDATDRKLETITKLLLEMKETQNG
jgi:hypothetical protein